MTHVDFAMTTLLNGIWQGTFLAATMGLLLKLLPTTEPGNSIYGSMGNLDRRRGVAPRTAYVKNVRSTTRKRICLRLKRQTIPRPRLLSP